MADPRFGFLYTDVLERVSNRERFIEHAAQMYGYTALEWGCHVDMSDRRLGDAFDYWCDDATRTLNFGLEERRRVKETPGASPNPLTVKELDHYKHASMIAFWLRRTSPINLISTRDENKVVIEIPPEKMTTAQKHFIHYGNELTALLCGTYLVFAYHVQDLQNKSKDQSPLALLAIQQQFTSRIMFPRKFIFEYPKLLKHKNISSQAMYMIYHSMFQSFFKTDEDTPAPA